MAVVSGEGVPAQANRGDAPSPSMFDDAARVWAALWQGDRPAAEAIVGGLGREDFARLRLLARALDELTEREWQKRRAVKPTVEVPLPTDPDSAERWARANARAEGRAPR